MSPARDTLAERQRLLVASAALQRALVAREWQALQGQARPTALLATLWQRTGERAIGIGAIGAVLAIAAFVATRRRRASGPRTATGLALALTLARLGLALLARRRRA